MNYKRNFLLVISFAMILLFTACSNGENGPFDRFSAQVFDSNGNALDGVTVLVNGQNSGITSDNNGFFQLGPSYFTNGVDSVNRVSIGERGIVLASREIVPSNTHNLVFQFPKASGNTGAVSGSIYDDYTAEPLNGVKVIIFNENLGLFQSVSNINGNFDFFQVPEGNYQITAKQDDYHTGIAMVQVNSNDLTYQGISLQPSNKARYQDGIMVSGYIVDADTKAPLSGASISMTVDTGYLGMPEPWMEDPIEPMPLPDEEFKDGFQGDGQDMGMSMGDFAPSRYDPQYQETITDSNGYFEFKYPAIGYGLYLTYWKDTYLSGNDYFDIYGEKENLVLSLELKPLVMTSATGKVVDELGQPVKGAYLELIFAGDEIKYYEDDFTPLGLPADPGWQGMEEIAGDAAFGGIPQPPPGMPRDGGSGNPFDNPLMQKYRWEKTHDRNGESMGMFSGFYGVNTNDLGEFSIDELPAGAYYYFVSAYRHQADSGDLIVVENPAENYYEFTIPNIPVGSVVGTVVDEFGKVLPNALVNCVQPRIDPFAYTDENGEYRIDNIPIGNWIVSAFHYGYLTQSIDTYIGEDEVVTINMQVQSYIPPEVTTVHFTGRILNGNTYEGIEGARMIFTTADNQFYFDSTSGPGGFYSAELIATEYNVLIQASEFQDLYLGFWVDSLYPQFDFSLWSIYGSGGSWGGILPGGAPPPMAPGEGGFMGDPASGDDLGEDKNPPPTPFDPDDIFNDRR